MSKASLDGAFARVTHAHRYLDELKSKIAARSDYADGIRFAQEFHADTSSIEVTLKGVPKLPVEWSLLAADSLQSLRAALNYVAWELSRWNLDQQGLERKPSSKTQFPINTKVGEFSRWRLPDVHPDHVAVIERLQPNFGVDRARLAGEAAAQVAALGGPGGVVTLNPDIPTDLLMAGFMRNQPLAVLATLTNMDKHEVLPATVIASPRTTINGAEAINCVITDTNVQMHMHLENDAHWAEYKVTPSGAGKPEVQVNDEISPEIQFAGYPISSLARIGHAVERIIITFAGVIDW
jgi:hypothetical protein